VLGHVHLAKIEAPHRIRMKLFFFFFSFVHNKERREQREDKS